MKSFVRMIGNVAILVVGMTWGALAEADENSWSTNGPYNCRVMAIAIHPSNNQIIYVGTVENGVYLTTDGGQEWGHLDTEILPTTIRDVDIHPDGPDTMYVCTVRGLYKSVDSGANWNVVVLPCGADFEVRGLTIHPTYQDLMFVTGPSLDGTGYRTSDGGQTWQELVMPLASMHEFVVDPVNDSIVYCVTGTAVYRKTLFKSRDYGLTWANLHNNLDTTTTSSGFAIDPSNPDILYIGGDDWEDATGRCLYESTDGGDSWTDITPAALRRRYVLDVLVTTSGGNAVYICTYADGLLKSTDHGATWEDANAGLTGRLIKSILYDGSSGYFYLGTIWDGIYRSVNGGQSWEKISYRIPNTSCLDYAVNAIDPAQQVISALNGLYFTNDAGLTWQHVDILSPFYNSYPGHIMIDSYNPSLIVGGMTHEFWSPEPSYVLRSDDAGVSWDTVYSGLPGSLIFKKLGQAHYENQETRYYLATRSGLYVSTDTGLTWSLAGNGLPEDIYHALAISPVDQHHVYVGGYGLHRTTNSGNTWEPLTAPVGGSYVSELICDPANIDIVYAIKAFGGIYRSTDGGNTWASITNLPSDDDYRFFSGIAINPQNPANLFVNSHHFGLFQSHDHGATWEPFNEGLNINYSSAYTVIDPSDTSRVYLATDQQSAWSIHRTTSAVDDESKIIPSEFRLINYPNPFNGVTLIRFTLPQSQYVTITVCDAVGRRILQPVKEVLRAGSHNIKLDMGECSSGAYSLVLGTPTRTTTRRILLIK